MTILVAIIYLVKFLPKNMSSEGLKLTFLDLETLGHLSLRRVQIGEETWCLYPNHEIIEKGAVVADPVTREIVSGGEFEIKISPTGVGETLMDPETEKITHYLARKRAGEWAKAVSLQEGMRKLLEFSAQFGKLVLGNQNFFFDWSFMIVARAVCGITEAQWGKYFHYGMFDTRSMAIQELWVPGMPFNPSDYSVRQDLLCQTLGIPPEPVPHTALNGAKTAFMVWKKLTELKEKRLA